MLILDEATSALDSITEEAIMNDIYKLHNQKTAIMIAHRVTSLKRCDVIYHVEDGKIISHGTYVEMLETNSKFRRLANASAH